MDLKNWKKAFEKMKAHANSEIHILLCEAEMAAARHYKRDPLFNNYSKLWFKRS